MKCKFSLITLTALSLALSASAQILKINTVVGNGIYSFSGDGGTATNAGLAGPLFVDFDTTGNYYILDYWNRRVRKVNTAGTITTIAGNGTVGNTGDGSLATNASMSCRGLAIARNGDAYISDESYSVIRKVNNATGIITRYAGSAMYGYSGNGGPALSAKFRTPYGLALDTAGNLYVADAAAHSVRKITVAGVISTVAGDDTAGFSGDFGLASQARLDSPYAVAVDRKGNIYISDHGNNVVRKVDAAGIITTFAGTYLTYGRTGDGGLATLAALNAPSGINFDAVGNVYIADADNHVIRKVDTFGIITTVVATGTQGFGGDLGPVLSAQLDNPYDLAFSKNGTMYIADANNQRIRQVYNPALSVGTTSGSSNVTVYPNPADDMVTIAGLDHDDNVILYDLTGRKVTETNNGSAGNSIILRSLTAGTYFLHVTDAAGHFKTSVKFVKK